MSTPGTPSGPPGTPPGPPETSFRPALLVPHYDHLEQFERFLPKLMATEVPLLVVDDGSPAEQRERLSALAASAGFELLERPENRGKGDALLAGFAWADRLGYTHALQMDADGQHDTGDVARFLDCARERPRTLVCGAPVFGKDAPWVRVWGRKLTDFVVALETWSFGVRDALCGFRVYPLAGTLEIIARDRPGERMDFDADMLVLARWHGMDLHFLDTKVAYPEQGRSHFRYVRDNLRMVGLHVRLLLRMLLRIPVAVTDRLTGRMGRVTGEPR